MRKNTLIIINGLAHRGRATRMYYNVTKELALARFHKSYPEVELPHILSIDFDDEIHLNALPVDTAHPKDIYVVIDGELVPLSDR